MRNVSDKSYTENQNTPILPIFFTKKISYNLKGTTTVLCNKIEI
jgi:hypothetical protein